MKLLEIVTPPPAIYQRLSGKNKWKFLTIWIICTYTDVLLIFIKGNWSNHLDKLEPNRNKLKYNELKFNILNFLSGQTEMKYMGFWETCDGTIPLNKKIIVKMTP